MTNLRVISLITGGISATAAFVVAYYLLLYGGYIPERSLLVYASVALGPILMISVMVGYGVWWFTLFVLTLIGFKEDKSEY